MNHIQYKKYVFSWIYGKFTDLRKKEILFNEAMNPDYKPEEEIKTAMADEEEKEEDEEDQMAFDRDRTPARAKRQPLKSARQAAAAPVKKPLSRSYTKEDFSD